MTASIKSRKLSTITPERVEWLAEGLIAVGKLNIIAGLPGCGKSLTTCSLASALSTGSFWPPANKNLPLTNVLLIGGEDDINDTVVPRLIAAGANLDHIENFDVIQENNGVERSFSLETDLHVLKDKIVQDNVGLLIIDPITGFLGRKDSYKDADVRSLLIPLSQLAAELKLTVLAIMHLNKGEPTGSALKKVSGSIAFSGVARNVAVLGKHPSDDNKRILVSAKTNIGRDGKGNAFIINPAIVCNGIETATIEWLDEKVTITADELLSSSTTQDPSALQEAKEFLLELLKNGPIDSAQVLAEAALNGISEATLRRAKDKLGVVSMRSGGIGKNGKWDCSLPTC